MVLKYLATFTPNMVHNIPAPWFVSGDMLIYVDHLKFHVGFQAKQKLGRPGDPGVSGPRPHPSVGRYALELGTRRCFHVQGPMGLEMGTRPINPQKKSPQKRPGVIYEDTIRNTREFTTAC